jgi:hypothetical protein
MKQTKRYLQIHYPRKDALVFVSIEDFIKEKALGSLEVHLRNSSLEGFFIGLANIAEVLLCTDELINKDKTFFNLRNLKNSSDYTVAPGKNTEDISSWELLRETGMITLEDIVANLLKFWTYGVHRRELYTADKYDHLCKLVDRILEVFTLDHPAVYLMVTRLLELGLECSALKVYRMSNSFTQKQLYHLLSIMNYRLVKDVEITNREVVSDDLHKLLIADSGYDMDAMLKLRTRAMFYYDNHGLCLHDQAIRSSLSEEEKRRLVELDKGCQDVRRTYDADEITGVLILVTAEELILNPLATNTDITLLNKLLDKNMFEKVVTARAIPPQEPPPQGASVKERRNTDATST